MTVLDAYALIAYVIGGPAQEKVITLLREGKCTIATANLIEVFDVVGRQHDYPVGRVAEIVDPLFATSLSVVHLDEHLARRAGELRVEHYHRTRSPLSLADVVLIVSARSGDRIATADPDVLATASSLGVETVELPGQG
ncbi:MAG TPA: PIN domain-containing protein [Solirubrobacterales bacterium]|nr:PIN domain-containing protein [Solirubrobacterales bacterium]